MEDLRASFEALGFQRVKTYVQSGNVTFDVVKAHSNNMSKSIEGKIKGDCGFPVLVVLRTLDEMKKIVRDNPFLNERGSIIPNCTLRFVGVSDKDRLGKSRCVECAP